MKGKIVWNLLYMKDQWISSLTTIFSAFHFGLKIKGKQLWAYLIFQLRWIRLHIRRMGLCSIILMLLKLKFTIPTYSLMGIIPILTFLKEWTLFKMCLKRLIRNLWLIQLVMKLSRRFSKHSMPSYWLKPIHLYL